MGLQRQTTGAYKACTENGCALIGGETAEADSLDQLLALAEKAYGKEVTQQEVGAQLKKHWQIQPPENCTACHG